MDGSTSGRGVLMTKESHIAALQRRHHELKRELEEELQHKSQDDFNVRSLKRRKLEIKDELAKLANTAA